MKQKPGYRFRVLAHRDEGMSIAMAYRPAERVCFDEVVVDDWLHVEQMDTRKWWISVAGVTLWVDIPYNGPAQVSHDGKALAEYGITAD